MQKNLEVNHLPLERGLAVQTWTSNRKTDDKALNLSLKVSNDSGPGPRED